MAVKGTKLTSPMPPNARGKTQRSYGEIVAMIRALPDGVSFGPGVFEGIVSQKRTASMLNYLWRRGELTRIKRGVPGRHKSESAVYALKPIIV